MCWTALMIVITSGVWYKTRPGLAIADPGIITHMYRHGCRGAGFNSYNGLSLSWTGTILELFLVDDWGTWRTNPNTIWSTL